MSGVKHTLKDILADKKNHRRWLSVFLLLALVVSLTTTALLMLPSLAANKNETVCICPYGAHQHTAACYDENGWPCCDYAYSHLHNERCYNESGELICTLSEVEPHSHVDSCYTVRRILICGQEESAGHVHTDSCYEMTRGALICGNTDEDHVHDDSCYAWDRTLVCTIPEGEGAHTHTDACYSETRELTCVLPELPMHVHSDACFTVRKKDETPDESQNEAEDTGDPTADVENAAAWERSFAGLELGEDWAENLLAIAETQLGYRESERNYLVTDGVKRGYTRYGAWYGAPYCDWCAAFISFCLYYVDIPTEYMPREASCNRWITLLTEQELYREIPDPEAADEAEQTEAYLPKPGDLVFFRMQSRTGSDHVGIVATVDEENNQLTTIEGNADNQVKTLRYELTDTRIIGYAALPEKPAELSGNGQQSPRSPVTLETTYRSADGGSFTVTVVCEPESGIPENATLVVREPDAAEYADYLAQTAEALSCSEAALGPMQLLDITIYCDGVELQPQNAVQVTIRQNDAQQIEDAQVVHFGDEPEVINSQTVDGEIRFETDGFSVYAIVGTTIEEVVLASDGNTYHITVTCPEEAGVPQNARLSVTEIPQTSWLYDGYVSISESALGWEEGTATYVRLFDIKILNTDGSKIEIAAPVDVKISLADEEAIGGLQSDTCVVHIADGAEKGDVLEQVEIEGETVSFAAEGFSAYVIVAGPDAVDMGFHKITSFSELLQRAAQGVYVGNPNGYYFMNVKQGDSSRMGIKKTAKGSVPTSDAALYFFEPVEGTTNQVYAYCLSATGQRQYVVNRNNNSLLLDTTGNKTAFTVTDDGNGVFRINNGAWYWNMQGGINGKRFCSYNVAADVNNNLNFWYRSTVGDDPYNLDNVNYGLMYYTTGLTGKGVMAEPVSENALNAKPMTVLVKPTDHGDQLFAPSDRISLWVFHWISDDIYTLSTIADGARKYLQIDGNGASLSDDPVYLQVVPGTGIHSGEICLKSTAGKTMTYRSDEQGERFAVGGNAGTEWLHLVTPVDPSQEEGYFMTYSADKISISDPLLTKDENGELLLDEYGDPLHPELILYTRVWDESLKRYRFYAVDFDGSLVEVFESGDVIQWVGNRNSSLLWRFIEYYWEGSTDPNYYYELQNQYSEQYIAPQVTGGQILSDGTIGINLNGRRHGYFYSSILAWDDANYAYAGLKIQNGRVVSCPMNEADDFYFARIQPPRTNDNLTEVPTVDNDIYGIKMRIVDFNGETIKPNNADTTKQQMDVMGNSDFVAWVARTGLLSTDLAVENGEYTYPTATLTGKSLGELFADARPVNHLFIASTLNGTGYFEFDSTHNFAHLKDDGNFVVYQELGTYDSGGNRPTLKHGQFFPFNDLVPGVFADTNGRNLYTATGEVLPDDDPRKNERLYLLQGGPQGNKADCFFGIELEASFVQTPNGHDDWGHDIIYEFTGDDDFWLYVDGELVIDLGGIHSALAGNVNYCTGEIVVNGTHTTLYDTFKKNYKTRNPNATEAEVTAYLEGLFTQNDHGQWVFPDYTTHEMKIFYMERGAGASNLHMRFNLSAVKDGTVLLNKELSGVDNTETVAAEFPYQIYYKLPKDNAEEENLLDNDPLNIYVVYKDTITPVTFRPSLTVDGIVYQNVFLLKPGETAEIRFPDETISYRIVECGVNTDIYSNVKANGVSLTGTPAGSNHADYGIDYETTRNRAHVAYENEIRPEALRTLTIRKVLYDVDGVTQIHDRSITFGYRLYIGTEYSPELVLANMYTYHVKDQDGVYCVWNAAQQKLIPLDSGKTDYNTLTDAEKRSVSFTTSMNGSISKIPADFTVEVRELLAGTRFQVEERDYEIPDGYSRVKYVVDGENSTTAVGMMHFGEDPHVDVINKKGYGLRVRKTWSDTSFMEEREPTYFGIFVGNSDTPLADTVYQLPQTGDLTLYWYFDTLVDGAIFSDYHIREVAITNPTVDENGKVSSYGTIARVENGETISFAGKQIGDPDSSTFTYTVTYRETPNEENVRLFTAANERPGITLRKTDWNGNPLGGAKFALTRGDVLVGEYTAASNGLITVAYLSAGVDYTLTETLTPAGHHGLNTPMTLRLNADGTLSVSGIDPDYYVLTPDSGVTAQLAIKNRSYNFRFLKEDVDGHTPLAGAKFELHRGITGYNGNTMDARVMSGYGNLVSDADGVIQRLNTNGAVIAELGYQLPAGTYYLKEVTAPAGYASISGTLCFTVDNKGVVQITDDVHPERGQWLVTTVDPDTGGISYCVTIPNERAQEIHILKTDLDGHPLEGAAFSLYRAADFDEAAGKPLDGATPIFADTTTSNGLLTLGELTLGNYFLVETTSPNGYRALHDPVDLVVTRTGVMAQLGSLSCQVTETDGVWQVRVVNDTGIQLPATGGSGTAPIYLIGGGLLLAAAILLLLRRRKIKQ